MLGFVKGGLCQYQRRLTATQVPGTGVAPASGTGSLSFKVHLSAPAPPTGADNPDPFVINYTQQAQNGTADPFNGMTRVITPLLRGLAVYVSPPVVVSHGRDWRGLPRSAGRGAGPNALSRRGAALGRDAAHLSGIGWPLSGTAGISTRTPAAGQRSGDQ